MLSYTVRLGRGLYTETFAAVLESEGERMDVAVKRPRRGGDHDAARAEALEAWGRAQLSIEGPHLVAVLEVGRTEEGPYVIQERVEGAPLGSVLAQLKRKRRSLKPALALRVASELAHALAELHAAGEVHGRLDPDEVLISYEGEVRLGDAGLHRLAGLEAEPAPASPYARPSAVGGVPTAADDVYALALIALEALLGAPVWAGGTVSLPDAVKALADMSPLAQAHPELARALTPLFSRALALEGAALTAAEWAAAADRRVEAADARARPSELGAFVRAVTPVKTSDDAPTMVAGAQAPVDVAEDNPFKVATVAVNAELLAFLEGGGPRPRAPTPRAPPQGMRAASRPPGVPPAPRASWGIWLPAAALLVLVVILLARC